MLFIDVGRADNFYESTLSGLKRGRKETVQNNDPMERIKLDENFSTLMDMGFDRRFARNAKAGSAFRPYLASAKGPTASIANTFELNKSRKEQLEELKKQRLQEKKQVFKYIPSFLHKYIDYLNSLKTRTVARERNQSLGFSAFFSFVVWANQGARSAFMYYVIGSLISMSMLLQRGMPKIKMIPGAQRRQVGAWSATAFRTALALTLLFTIPSAIITFFVSAVVPGFDVAARAKAAMICSMFANSLLSANYEVFEDRSKNGSRWRKAVAGYLEPNLEAKLSSRIFNKKTVESFHLIRYNPEIEENPYQPKYLDEMPGAAPLAGQGDLDETESKTHFDTWRTDRENSRREPLVEAAPELPWMGGKVGMYVTPPNWLSSAYLKSVKKMNAWRGLESKYKQDYSEFEVTTVGPFAFRDKHPEWLDAFGSNLYEEQLSVSRALARSFGTYRKTMWKLDKEVKLESCDGADKEKDKKKGK